jgi:hypothetical protein
MRKRYVEWDRKYVLKFTRSELIEKSEEIMKEIGEEAYRMLVEFAKKWDEFVEKDERFGNILDFTVIINEDGTVNWRESFATVMYFPTPAPPITIPEMAASMAGYRVDPARSLFEPFFEPPEPVIVYIMRFLREGKGIVLP